MTLTTETLRAWLDNRNVRAFLYALGYPISLIDDWIHNVENETMQETIERMMPVYGITPEGEQWLDRIHEKAKEDRPAPPPVAWPFAGPDQDPANTPPPLLEADAAEHCGCAPRPIAELHIDPARED
jgi:hypothetical protein